MELSGSRARRGIRFVIMGAQVSLSMFELGGREGRGDGADADADDCQGTMRANTPITLGSHLGRRLFMGLMGCETQSRQVWYLNEFLISHHLYSSISLPSSLSSSWGRSHVFA